MNLNNKSIISPIIITAFLLVIAVIFVAGFSIWFDKTFPTDENNSENTKFLPLDSEKIPLDVYTFVKYGYDCKFVSNGIYKEPICCDNNKSEVILYDIDNKLYVYPNAKTCNQINITN